MARFDVRILNKLLDSYERSSLAKGQTKLRYISISASAKSLFRSTLMRVPLPLRKSMPALTNLKIRDLSGLSGKREKKTISSKSWC